VLECLDGGGRSGDENLLGFSNCAAFDAVISGTTFVRPAALANYGAAVPLVSDFGHFLEDLQSDGTDTLMDPGLSNGVRVLPTQLDRAVFTDLGYES
jgi:hypothetical protein